MENLWVLIFVCDAEIKQTHDATPSPHGIAELDV